MRPLGVGETDGLGRRVALRRAVGEAAAESQFLERAKVLPGEFRRANIVAPVVLPSPRGSWCIYTAERF
jgi:hypothetical protein